MILYRFFYYAPINVTDQKVDLEHNLKAIRRNELWL